MTTHRAKGRHSLIYKILRFLGLKSVSRRSRRSSHKIQDSSKQIQNVTGKDTCITTQIEISENPNPSNQDHYNRSKHYRRRRRSDNLAKSIINILLRKTGITKRRYPSTLHLRRRSGIRHRHKKSINYFNILKQFFTRAEEWLKTDRRTQGRLNSLLKQSFSVVSFICAYILVWLIYQSAVIVTASFFDIHSVLFYYEVMFTCGNFSPLWSAFNIILITLSGPLINLFLALVTFFLLYKRRITNPFIYQFLLWIMVISAAHFFGAFIAGAITRQGFGYVINWMFMPFILRLIVSLIFIIILILIGWYSASFYQELTRQKMSKSEKPMYLLRRYIFPWFLAVLILLALKIPDAHVQHENIWDYDMFILSSTVFMIVPPLFNQKASSKEALNWPKKRNLQSGWLYSGISIGLLLILFYRIGLSHGIYVFLKLSFHLSVYK